ncbi:MAG: LicD family protein [Eubacteriales bacterium]|nr:LicD family protein [Eubacteriales bacterium]
MDSTKNENQYKYSAAGRASVKEHQEVLYEMLCDLDDVCRKLNISYQLFAGTLLGAVRHKGFIPWDDDLDVVMLREEYDRFLSQSPALFDQEKYYLQKEYSEHWSVHFSKLRKNNTACIERYIPKDEEEHQGIYIDIFPCDNLSENACMRTLQFLASKVVIAKCLDRHGYITNRVIKKVFIQFCRLLPIRSFRKLAQQRTNRNSRMVHTFFGASSKYRKSIYPRKWFEESTELSFEGRKFPVSSYYRELLTVLYGNYMEIPPESERGKKVHAEIVDTEHSYIKYKGIQKTMKFSEYTRSIR